MGVETILSASRLTATPAMTDDSQLSFKLPSVSRKKVTAAFDGGRLSSDSGVMLLALADRRRRVADTLAALIADPRDRSHIRHTVADVLRACWRLAAATLMATTSIGYGSIRPSNLLAVGCPTADRTSARNQLSRVGRMHHRCARSSASPMPWSISGAGATR